MVPRVCPTSITHGGILIPVSSSASRTNLHLCGMLWTCRSRSACELVLQCSGARKFQPLDRRRLSKLHLSIARGHDHQPGPQEDDCAYPELGLCSAHEHLAQPQHPLPQHPLGLPEAVDPSLYLESTSESKVAPRAHLDAVTPASHPPSASSHCTVAAASPGSTAADKTSESTHDPESHRPQSSRSHDAVQDVICVSQPLRERNPSLSSPSPKSLPNLAPCAESEGEGVTTDGGPFDPPTVRDGSSPIPDSPGVAAAGPGAAPGPELGVELPLVPPGPVPTAPGGSHQLPPLRLSFLDWSKLQLPDQRGSSDSAASSSSGRSSQPQRPPIGGRRRRGGGGGSEGRSRSDRVLQLLMGAQTLLQLRAVVSRHLSAMSAGTAAVAMSRLASRALVTMRLRRVGGQMQPETAVQTLETLQQRPSPSLQRGGWSGYVEGASTSLSAELSGGVSGGARSPEGPVAGTDPRRGLSSTGGLAQGLDASSSGLSRQERGSNPATTATSADSSRVQPGSLHLMRLLLRHIAECVDGGGPVAASAATAGGGFPGRAARKGAHRWGDHRAWLAGWVLRAVAQVGMRPGPGDLWALYRLVEAARPDLFLASPRQLSLMASSLPLLPPLRPSASWLDHFASVARSKMYAAEPGHLAAWVWCLARLGHNPGDLWLHSLTHHLSRDGNMRAASPSQLCQVLWALHRLDFQPDPDWKEECAVAVLAALTPSPASTNDTRRAPRHAPMGPMHRRRGLRARYDRADERDSKEEELYDSSSSVDEFEPEWEMDARGGSGAGPSGGSGGHGPRWRYGSHVSGGDVASLLLWAVRMGVAPGPAGFQSCLDRLKPGLRYLRRMHLMRLLLALSESGQRPGEDFMARLLGALQPKLSLMGPTQLTQLLMAVLALRFVPPQLWLVTFLKASRSQLRHYTPTHVTATYQVFAGWHLRPSKSYLTALHTLLDALLPQFTPQGLASVLQSMSSLGIKPQHRWTARALEALAEGAARGGNAGPGGASTVALTPLEPVRAGSPPSNLTRVTPSVPGYSALPPLRPLHAQSILTSPPLLPSPGFGSAGAPGGTQQQQQQSLQGQGQALRRQQRAATAAALVTAVCSLRGIVQLLPLQRDGEGERSTLRTGETIRPDVANVDPAIIGQEPPSPTAGSAKQVPLQLESDELLPFELWSAVKAVTDQCGQLLDVTSGVELARLLTALSRLNFYPGRTFLAEHSRATALVGSQLAAADKEALAVCYSRLAALAPRMAEEARRQAEARQTRAAVLVGKVPWGE